MPSLGQHGHEASKLFSNLLLPASVLAGAVVSAGLITPLPAAPSNEKQGATFVRKTFPMLAFATIASEILCIIWSTMAINQLSSKPVPMTETVWALLHHKQFALYWTAVNAHFVMGMLGFLGIIAARVYFMTGQGPAGNSAVGIIGAVTMYMLSIVNRTVTTGGGKARFGGSVMALFQNYARLLWKGTSKKSSFGPLETAAFILFCFSVWSYFTTVWKQTKKSKKKD